MSNPLNSNINPFLPWSIKSWGTTGDLGGELGIGLTETLAKGAMEDTQLLSRLAVSVHLIYTFWSCEAAILNLILQVRKKAQRWKVICQSPQQVTELRVKHRFLEINSAIWKEAPSSSSTQPSSFCGDLEELRGKNTSVHIRLARFNTLWGEKTISDHWFTSLNLY